MTAPAATRQLVVIAEMGSGGAESIVVQLAQHAVARGEEVLVASSAGWRTTQLAEAGVDHLDVPLAATGLLALLRSALSIRRRLAAEPVDVVHAHNVRAALAAWLAVVGHRGRPRILVTVHGLAAGRYWLAARLLAVVADEVVAVSDDVRRKLEDARPSPAPVHVVTNAPDVPQLVDRAVARAELGCRDDLAVVLCLARLAPPKRHDLLLDGWDQLPEARLLVAGDGTLRGELEALAGRRGIDDRVHFLGDRRDVGRLLAAADVLVLPSDSEGLPVAVLEAMISGVPVVASRVGGLAALDGTCLRLVEPGSAAALIAGISGVLRDAAGSAVMVERARDLALRHYSTMAMAEAYASRTRALAAGRLAKRGKV